MSEQRPIQISKVVFAQVADRLPEILLRLTAEDLRRLPLRARGGIREVQPSAPHAIVRLANAQLEEKLRTVETEGG
jgi:hypothetical protein